MSVTGYYVDLTSYQCLFPVQCKTLPKDEENVQVPWEGKVWTVGKSSENKGRVINNDEMVT